MDMKIKIFFRNGEFTEIECDDVIIKKEDGCIELIKCTPKYNWPIAFFYKNVIAGFKIEH